VFALGVEAQISGDVKDRHGMPLVGANIRWLGDHSAILSDQDGKFQINATTGNKFLVCNYVGYVGDTVHVSNSREMVHFILADNITLSEAKVVGKRKGTFHDNHSLENKLTITSDGLMHDACCNLGESFVSNPSVDVSYSDAATGAKQIKLLGLSGTYIQMLTENIPNFRFAAAPYGLGYIPGTWMQSIQVSKGVTSVKQGYEAMTGQINVEYKKPHQHEPDYLFVNAYADHDSKYEANADATLYVGDKWKTTLFGHYENQTKDHDDNHDTFDDIPQVEQLNLMNRWTYQNGHYTFIGSAKMLSEDRLSGQVNVAVNPYQINIKTNRYEAFTKNALELSHEHETSIALILSGSWHHQDATYGKRLYDVKELNGYGQLLFETNFTHQHALSLGGGINHDGFHRHYRLTHNDAPNSADKDLESVWGGYAQYTFNLHDRLVAMAGIRADHSNLYGMFATPRIHVKYTTPNDAFCFRISAGKGYRTAHIMDENNYLFAGSRQIVMENNNLREESWNYGASTNFKIPIYGKKLELNAEYYYTNFNKQAVCDMDSDPHKISFYQLKGHSFSQVVQLEASYPFFQGFKLTAAYRFTDARCNYGGVLREKPLTNRYKALFSSTYKTPHEKWQFDATLQLNGGGRMPLAYKDMTGKASWQSHFHGYPQLSAQITHNIHDLSIYIGGENLTNYKQNNPIIDATNPWGDNFDPTMIYAPVHGANVYLGIRYKIPREHHH